MPLDLNLRLSGEAGQGIDTTGSLLSKVFHRDGYHVFTHQDYMSRIRGGHNYFQIRVADRPVEALEEQVDLLVALQPRDWQEDRADLREGGRVLTEAEVPEDPAVLTVPFTALAEQAGGRLYANTVAAGAALALVGHPLDTLEALLEEQFARKGAAVVEQNRLATRLGHDFVLQHHAEAKLVDLPLLPPHDKLLIGGIEALALAALAAGVQVYSAYPMTPSTGILNYLAGHAAEFGVVVQQAEDEIAAINLALGASYAGARSMVATSGGGFALMVESLSLAGITETPLVLGLGQRPGPATGLPTRTEQGELWFALHAGHGEFPRFVFAPGNPTEAFELTFRAFNLADKYQTPAVVLFDQYLADMLMTVPRFDFGPLSLDRHLATVEEIGRGYAYARYAETPSGVSPRAVPGTAEAVVEVDSDEHDAHGHIIEDAATRKAMVEKRLRKEQGMRREIVPPLLEGDPEPEVLLIGWGSTRGVIAEALQVLREQDVQAARLHCSQLWPFPAQEVAEVLRSAQRSFVVENNATGQLERLIARETRLPLTGGVHRYDGRPFSPAGIVEEIRKQI
ncbi:MAG: 2-oxoacid:acceptor oxidoreductase subunit alpha [candidate division WS1 bacterium]|nr:2-oxoacid:acceptor oxidoreductase subunit alpha [candidate division WS1 bacterium]